MSFPQKLSDEQVAAIRADRRPIAEIARTFGISISYVSNLRNGRRRAPAGGETVPLRRDPKRFDKLKWLARAPVGTSVLLDLPSGRPAQGPLQYWQQKLGVRFRRRMTNHGLRVWRIA